MSQAAHAPSTFEIKSAHLSLVALMLKSADLDSLSNELQAQFGDQPEFFDNDPLVIDLSSLPSQDASSSIDFSLLAHRLRSYRLLPVAVRGGTKEQMQAAISAGLAPAQEEVRHHAAAAPATAPTGEEVAIPPGAVIVDRPLRSGQQVYARGADLVVLAMVNHGAEVIADGHVHVYAPLRGKAIAGARGRTDARIFAMCMEPELVSICGVYRTSENALPDDIWGKPTQVHLSAGPEGDKLVMSPIAMA